MRPDQTDPLIAALGEPGTRYTCKLGTELAGVGTARRTAILQAIVTGRRGAKQLAHLLEEHGIEVSEAALARHRYSGCRVCGIEAKS